MEFNIHLLICGILVSEGSGCGNLCDLIYSKEQVQRPAVCQQEHTVSEHLEVSPVRATPLSSLQVLCQVTHFTPIDCCIIIQFTRMQYI